MADIAALQAVEAFAAASVAGPVVLMAAGMYLVALVAGIGAVPQAGMHVVVSGTAVSQRSISDKRCSTPPLLVSSGSFHCCSADKMPTSSPLFHVVVIYRLYPRPFSICFRLV